MKKGFILLGLAITIAACNSSKTSSSSDSTNATTTVSATANPKDTLGMALIAKYDCLTCHKVDQKVIGPSYIDVANKYTASPAVIDTLAMKVIKGGAGNWGAIAMTPHPSLTMDDSREMIKYILSLKK